jgi:hypothetical protein
MATMYALIDALRRFFGRRDERPPHVVERAIERLERNDLELERRIMELRMRVEVETRTTGRERGRGPSID